MEQDAAIRQHLLQRRMERDPFEALTELGDAKVGFGTVVVHEGGDDFRIECPTGSGRLMTLFQVAEEIGRRLTAIFLRSERGRRPVEASLPSPCPSPRRRGEGTVENAPPLRLCSGRHQPR